MVACGDEESDAPPAAGSGGKGATGGKGGSAGKSGTSGKGGSGNEGGDDATGGTGTGGTGTGGTGTGGTGNTDAGMAGQETGGTAGVGAEGGMGAEGGTRGSPEPCDLSGEGKTQETLPADIEADLTLTNDKVWYIDNYVKVHDGATLTIPACTRLVGSPAPAPGVLTILRGGKIDAQGTADAPILFTTSAEVGTRVAGGWGGVVLLGRAPITAATPAKLYEGLTDDDFTYGGDAADDNSGIMRYVRIEFGGYEILPDKEVNGLSMAAVGSGTTIDHIMVSNTSDDCFEWWGGSVKADYLVCNNSGDDMFDADEGYTAENSTWFGRRTTAGLISSSDPNGFEWDGTEGGAVLSPRTHVTIDGSTLCGSGATLSSSGLAPEFGMVLRELITGTIDGLALTGFEYGISTRNAIAAGDVTIDNSQFFGLIAAVGSPDATDDDGGFVDDSIFTGGTGNSEPDPVPYTLEDCQAEGGPASAVTGSSIGAFKDGDSWMDGAWVDWSAN
jgi:hypothetical protein